MNRAVLVVSFIMAFAFGGCDTNSLGTIDTRTDIPILTSASVSPDSIYIDSITPVGGAFPINAVVQVKVITQSNFGTVTASVVRTGTSQEILQAALRDDGVSPDRFPNDSVFTGKLEFSIQRALAGRYRIRIAAQLIDGSTSNVVERTLKLGRRNSLPILSNLNAPDTLQRPVTGALLFSMTVAAADSDGLADIREVVFQNLNSTSQARLPLFDDGGIRQPNGITSGDIAAGDGVFSTIVQLPDTVSPRTFLFKFQATDSFGDTSSAILHSLTIR